MEIDLLGFLVVWITSRLVVCCLICLFVCGKFGFDFWI